MVKPDNKKNGKDASHTQSNKKSIGQLRERSLHRAIIEWISEPGDEPEVRVDGYVADLVRGRQIIEIQTGNFSAIKFKLKRLLENHSVRLVFPIAQEKWIVTKDEAGQKILSRRKSPKRGSLLDLFTELVRIPELINHPDFSLTVLLIQTEEIRCDDGQGSWRRKGVSIINRHLLKVVQKVEFNHLEDFSVFLPKELPEAFLNKDLAKLLKVPLYRSRRIVYCLSKMGLIEETGRIRNGKIYQQKYQD